ncbi:MAG TPA: type I methionyl aminopeptidase [Deferrisomatales bacterium]|nr:type I methionyl aminopeptidase [Deferrisomatales bacterium]
MIIIKSPREIEQMRRANRVVAEILEILRRHVRPGVSTQDLEEIAQDEVTRRGVVPAFKGVANPNGGPYPACLCTSVNDEVVHGIPRGDRVLEEGDLLSVDFGVCRQGFYGDAAFSVPVGQASKRVQALILSAEAALAAGIEQARVGRRLGDLSAAVQCQVEGAGFTVVREFVGHGIGRSLHEEPQVPNFGKAGTGVKLKAGMVLAVEPMINDGVGGVKVDADGWTARTRDGSLAAHAEHTIAITDGEPLVLSRID